MPVEALAGAGIDETAIPGAAHAAEHAAIGMLPLSGDLGPVGHWRSLHRRAPRHRPADDSHLRRPPRRRHFAERAYDAFGEWLAATRAAIASCGCGRGVPACVQSPKCGNGNDPLDKSGAVALLSLVLGAADRKGSGGALTGRRG